MARTDNLTNFLTDVANSIRNVAGNNNSIPANSFDLVINNFILANETNLNITPSIVAQNFLPPTGYTGYNSVNISAVTNAIDMNITPQNIVNGVNILGITGNYIGTELNNQQINITENGTYTPNIGYTGFNMVNVNIDSIPNGVFIQETLPTKTTDEALWLKTEDVSSDLPLLDRIPLNTVIKYYGADITFQQVLNTLTQAQKDAINAHTYLLLVYNSSSYRGYWLGAFDSYMFSSSSNFYISGTSSKHAIYVISDGYYDDVAGLAQGPNLSAILDGYWSSNDLSRDGEILVHQTGAEAESGVYVTIDGVRYIVYTNKTNQWNKTLNTSDANATASDILNGKTAYVNNTKVTGNLVPLDTSDATATANDILLNKTAYVNNVKVIGTYQGSGGGNYVEINNTRFYVVTSLFNISDMRTDDYAYVFDSTSGNTYIYKYDGTNWIVPQQSYINIWYEEE